MKAKKVPLSVKRTVYERDNGQCQGCGRPVPFGPDPHHICFRSQARRDMVHRKENLVTLCYLCHQNAHLFAEHRRKWEEWSRKKYGDVIDQIRGKENCS